MFVFAGIVLRSQLQCADPKKDSGAKMLKIR